MNYSEILYKYIKDMLNTDKDFEEFCAKHNLVALYKDKLKDSGAYFEEDILSKVKYKYFKLAIVDEFYSLNGFLKENSIRGAFVKGPVLSYLLYGDPEKRFFGDIDMYVHKEDIHKAVDLLGQLGYMDREGNKITSDEMHGYYHRSHLKPFTKLKEVNGNVVEVTLEVHIIPFYINTAYAGIDSQSKYDRFYESIVSLDIEGTDFPTPDNETTFLFLLDHFSKHLLYSVTRIEVDFDIQSDFDLKIMNLYEAKIFYEKCKPDIGKIIESAYFYDIYHQVRLGIKYINEMFKDSPIPFELAENNAYTDNLLESKLCGIFEKYTLKDIVTGDSVKKDIIKNMKDRAFRAGMKLKVPKKDIWMAGSEFHADETRPTNDYGTHLCKWEKPESKFENSLSGTLMWDEKYFHIHIFALDNKFPALNHGKSMSVCFDATGYMHSESAKIKALFFRVFPKENDNLSRGYELIVQDLGYIIDITRDFICSVSVIEGVGISCYMSLPWDLIGIAPSKGVHFGFDIKTMSIDENGKERSLISLCDISEVSNPNNYADIELV